MNSNNLKKKAICYYHVVDADGVFSCLIVNKWIKDHQEFYETLDIVGWTYGMSDPPIDYENYDLIFIVDLALSVDIMKRLSSQNKAKVVWIDHHLGNIEFSDNYGYNNLPGLRELGKGACELCWEYLFDSPTPLIIQQLSAYDVWNKDRFNWDTDTLPLQLGLKTLYGIKVKPILPIFEELINDNNQIKNRILDIGRNIKLYEDRKHKIACKNYSFPVTVAGKYKGICCLTTEFGSALYDSVNKDYEIFICTNKKTLADTGKVIYPISMYSNIGECDLNLAKYMQNFGGNGHFNAAGGVLTEDQFFNLIKNQKI